jgi:formate dehydrogenase maturation protein FdhE
MSNEMNKQESEQLAKKAHAMHLQMRSLRESISQCLTTMDPLADAQEKAAAEQLRVAFVQAIDGPITEVLEQLPTDNMMRFVGAFAALNLAWTSIGAYGDAWDQDLASARANKSNVVAIKSDVVN